MSWAGESVSEWAVQSLRSPKVVLEDPFQDRGAGVSGLILTFG